MQGGKRGETGVNGSGADGPQDMRLYRHVAWRIIPYLFLCYIFNYLDRTNVGFAKLEMLDDLRMSETAYGFGAGVFFIGYVAFGVPSNLAMQRIGARRWLGLIMVLWGLLSAALMFAETPGQFYVLRFLTGAAESGFFPGVVLYLTRWFPGPERGKAMALFMAAIPLSGVLGSPLSGWILAHFQHGSGGLAAWQWLFLIQGLPTALLGAGIFLILTDTIGSAGWLSPEQKKTLEAALDADGDANPSPRATGFRQVFINPAVWALGLTYFCIQSGVYAINFWLPTILKSAGLQGAQEIGWIGAIPYAFAMICMILVGRSADRLQERRWHLAGPMLLGGLGLLMAGAFAHAPWLAVVGMTFGAMGSLTGLPMFWPLAGDRLSAGAAVTAIALINSLGQIAGFVSPYFVGWIKDRTNDTDVALYLLGALLIVGAMLALAQKPRRA